MPAQAHLAAHAAKWAPPRPAHALFPSLPLHFSRATSPWQRGKRPLSLASSVTEWGVKGGVMVVARRQRIRRVERAAGVHSMPTQGDQGTASLATTILPLRTGFKCEGDWNRVGCCHTMSNQYELPRAVGPQRHISSKVALFTEMVAALKFTSMYRLKTHTYGSILRHSV